MDFVFNGWFALAEYLADLLLSSFFNQICDARNVPVMKVPGMKVMST